MSTMSFTKLPTVAAKIQFFFKILMHTSPHKWLKIQILRDFWDILYKYEKYIT